MNGRPECHTGVLLMTSLLGIWSLHPFHVSESHSVGFHCTMLSFTDVTPIAYFLVIIQFSRLQSRHRNSCDSDGTIDNWPVYDLPSDTVQMSVNRKNLR